MASDLLSRHSGWSTPYTLEHSVRSIASAKSFVDYPSLVKYVMAANVAIVPYSTLQINEKLGAGAFMTVFRGSCPETFGNMPLAIKIIDISLPRGGSELHQFTDDWEQRLAIFSLELNILSNSLLRHHANIVKLLGISFHEVHIPANEEDQSGPFVKPIMILEEAHPNHPTIEKFYEYAEEKKIDIDIETKVSLWCDVANALYAVHSVGIVHGDIKPANILLFKDRSNGKIIAKLSDFGGSQQGDAQDMGILQNLLGTEYWNAPEVYDESHLHYRSRFRDLFSFGLLGCYILFGSEPYGKLTEEHRESLRQVKMNWKSMGRLIKERLGRQWLHIGAKEAVDYLKSLPQATDPASFSARLLAYRQLVANGHMELGFRSSPSNAKANLAIRVPRTLDCRPFAMALGVTLFIHDEPYKRDQHGLLGNLSLFLNDEKAGKNARDIFGSVTWDYVLEHLDEMEIWAVTSFYRKSLMQADLNLHVHYVSSAREGSWPLLPTCKLKAIPDALRSFLEKEYEDRLSDCSSNNERILYLLASASLSVENVDRVLDYYLKAAHLGSRVARSVCAKLGPDNFADYADAPTIQQLNRWALENLLSPMAEMEKFLKRLEGDHLKMLESNDLLQELVEGIDEHDDLFLTGNYSPWIDDVDHSYPLPVREALKAVVLDNIRSLHNILEAENNLLATRFKGGDTLIHIAAEFNRTEMVVLLINKHKVDANLVNAQGMTPLAIAAIYNSQEVMVALLNAGAEYRHIFSARIMRYLANMAGAPMISWLVEFRNMLEKQWAFLPNMEQGCPSERELLEGRFSFFEGKFTEPELGGNPIFAAILGDQISSLQALLQRGCSQDVWKTFSSPDGDRCLAPIHLACQLRPLHVALLLHHGADVNVRTKDEFRQTPLQIACIANRRPCYRYPRARVAFDFSHMTSQMITEARLSMLRLLASNELVDFDAQDALGKTALHHCMGKTGCLPVIQALVQDFRASLQIQDVQLMTPLHHAATSRESELAYVQFCLMKLDDDAIDQPDIQGLTPLMHAVAARQGERSLDTCRCLMSRKCSLTRQSKQGETILHLAAREPGDRAIFSYIFDKINENDLISTLSAFVDKSGRTFAHNMARSGDSQIRAGLRLLPAETLAGLVNKVDFAGYTLLHETAKKGDAAMVEYLIENGANVGLKTEARLPPLCIARSLNHTPVVQLLLTHTPWSEDSEGKSPEYWISVMDKLEAGQKDRFQFIVNKVAAEIEEAKQRFKVQLDGTRDK